MMPISKRKEVISASKDAHSVSWLCDVLEVPRSSYYYEPASASPLNLELMELMDKHYLKYPFKGVRRMYAYLTMDEGYHVSMNRVARLYFDVMGLRSIMPGPHTSTPGGKDHKVYPYLLRDLKVDRPNQVWATDITYVPMERGYMYLTAVIDLFSRYIVSWSFSNTMDSVWCTSCVDEAVCEYGAPEIINTDQGSQYTSQTFTSYIEGLQGTRLSMDGKGRAIDNVFIERFWRTVKYENLYIYRPADGREARALLSEYIPYYNHDRRHSSLDDQMPAQWYGL